MTAPLTPVEELQREIAAVKGSPRVLHQYSDVQYLAALDLAKAAAAIPNHHMTHCDITMGDSHPCTCGIPRLVAKLSEALQQ